MSETASPHMLLAKALATLSEDEQGRVLKALLPVPAFGGQHEGWASEATAAMAGIAVGRRDEVVATYVVQRGVRPTAGDQVSLLVRLPAPLHAQLKEWSEAHGHSMNTVVRGLLERFLSSQSGAV